MQIALSKNGRVKKFKVHRLVALAFIPNPEGNPQINHAYGNKMDNCVDNLEWNTNSENNRHAFRTGLREYRRNSHRALTDEQVHWCRKVHIPFDKEFSLTALAKEFGVSQVNMNAILHRKTYKDVY